MKTKFAIYLTVLMTIFVFNVNSQEASMSTVARQYQNTMLHFQKIKKLANKNTPTKLNFEDIKGSPYLFDKSKSGKLYIQDSLIETNSFNLNLYSDEIEVIDNNQLYGIIKIDNTKLTIGEEIILLQAFLDDNGETNKGYFLEVWKGHNVSLFLKKNCKLVPPQKAATPNQKDRTAKFTIFDNYYILRSNETLLTKIKNNKSSIFQLMNDKKSELKQYIGDNNLNMKESEDLKKVFSFYNSLL